MKFPSRNNPQITEEAAEWCVRLDAGPLNMSESQGLAEWLRASPRHVEELLVMSAMLTSLDDVDSEKAISIDALLETAAPEVISLMRTEAPAASSARPVRRNFRHYPAAIAAVLCLFVVSAIVWMSLPPAGPDAPGEVFATTVGEQRSLTLSDGTIMHINTQTEVAIDFSENFRRVELKKGEAFFEIAHDTSRPFQVRAGGAMAEAVGTKFNVYRDATRTTIAVVEGKVAVDTDDDRFVFDPAFPVEEAEEGSVMPLPLLEDGRLLLVAGEKAEVEDGSHEPARLARANIESVSSWRMRRLVFSSDTLSEIAEQFNRYNRRHIVIDGEALADTRFSGVFDADDPQSLIDFLTLLDKVEVDTTDPDIIRLSAKAG